MTQADITTVSAERAAADLRAFAARGPMPADGRADLIGLDRAALTALFAEAGLPKFRANQVWQWIYHKGATSFDGMTNLAKPLRQQLAERFRISRPAVATRQDSVDGTIKWLMRFADGNEAEMVFIPETERGTLCISSQVGCTLTCSFCHTGTQRLVRNLTAGEIVGQVMLALDELDGFPTAGTDRRLTNIVLMGMGEPLYNFENVATALRVIMDNEGVALSRRRITLSTSGVVPMMERCGDEIGVNLAISLHATTDDTRDILVPINKKWPLQQLLDACRTYPGVNNARRITFEYVMLEGINDSVEDAKRLVSLIRGIPAKINLIPFNPWPGSNYVCSSDEQIERFAQVVLKAGYPSPVRTPRGRDILAACGQLKSESRKQTRRELRAEAAE
ncbi:MULTISPECIES: 23S rRNA (adenine(2503)-C(2))-methyltransferase RlmN [Thalassobaculum]|uniref:Dual-specificity RNA methyltransferase RlmN n=1 Tax=Thalassobaculum litoreum DSM 18839 TaxID=1123362 RepID=A0A8G2BI31_9PROT|nr:23S rRNA m(2)A-2503 methyltransferase [Thalassobaculum litoreum DSM 18839]